MATCRECIFWNECSIADGTTQFYGKKIAANNVEELCELFGSAKTEPYVNANLLLANIKGMLDYCERNPEVSNKTALLAVRDCVITNSTANGAPIADTVRKMQERFAVCFGTYTDKDMTPITEVFRRLDKIAKEMLEGEKWHTRENTARARKLLPLTS